jgi:glucose-1-phosphate cytidylyltransferase
MGTRLSEETLVKPKPMVEIGERPILWHIMKIYSSQGLNDFILALGYKGEVIKDYFLNYRSRNSEVLVDLATGVSSYGDGVCEDWRVRMIDTGDRVMTGGRLRRLKPCLAHEGTFMMTYGDAVARIDLTKLAEFHRRHGKLATVTAVRPAARFGAMVFDGDQVVEFKEKPQTGEGWINGGFFVFEPAVIDYIDDDQTVLEEAPLERLTADGQLMAYRLQGYWQCMDTMRDRDGLNEQWVRGSAPWKTW